MTFPKSLLNVIRVNKPLRLIFALSALAFIFKFYLLSQRTLYIDPDEGYYLLLARNLITGHGYTFNGLPNIIFPPFLPLLIGLLSTVLGNFQLSLNIITALSGTLLGLIVYLLARKKLPLLPSFGCFLLALLSLELNSYFPVAVSYTRVLYRGSDILNCALILAAIFFTILLLEKDRYLWAVLAAVSLSLAYLTRPEGFLLFIGLAILLLSLKLLSLIAISWKRLASFVLVFLVLAFPYVYYLKKTTGKWLLSGKVSASERYRSALLEVIHKENWAPFNKIHYALNKDGTEMNDLYFGYHRQADEIQDIPSDPPAERVRSNLRQYGIILKTLVTLPLLPFLLLGLGSSLLRLVKKRSWADLVILILLPYSILVEALSYPIPRHHLFLVPFVILYAGQGAALFASLVSSKNEVIQRKVLFLIFAVLFVFTVYDHIIYASRNLLNAPAFRSVRETEVAVARRLREAGAAVVMSLHPAVAVRASSDWQVLPVAALPRVLGFAKHKGVDWAVLPDDKKIFYHLLDLKNSDIPEDLENPFSLETLETHAFFDLIRIVKGKEP